MDAHSALVMLCDREGFWSGGEKVFTSALRKSSILQCEIREEDKEVRSVTVDCQNLSLPLPLLNCIQQLLLPSSSESIRDAA